jgi:hypothetical protein
VSAHLPALIAASAAYRMGQISAVFLLAVLAGRLISRIRKGRG